MANEKHIYLTFGGGYISSYTAWASETWQCGMRCSLINGATDDVATLPNNWNPAATTINRSETDWTITGNWFVDGPALTTYAVDDYLDQTGAPAVQAFIETSGLFSAAVELRWMKAYPIGTDGKAIPAPPYAVGSPITLTWEGGFPVGGAAGEMVPPQLSTVLSQRTSQVGARGRGRIFAPPLVVGAIDNGLLASATVTALSDAHVALLEGLADGTSPIDNWELRPAVIGAPWSSYATILTSVVDNVVDTQRRRRRKAIGTDVGANVNY